jgi:segregation and condensation protein B
MEHKKVMEAALFIANQPLTLDQLARLAGVNSLGHVKELMEELQKDYKERGLEVFQNSDGYTMQVRARLLPRVAHLTPYSDLGEGPKRTLALVTVREPVKQSEIIKIQGNKAYTYIKNLKKMGLVVTEKEGHTKILKLTQEFERYFGEEKAKIKEQLERHLQITSEGEPVYEEKPEIKEELVEQEFLDDKKPTKQKAKVSVIKEEATEEIPQEPKDSQEPESKDGQDEPESEASEEEERLKASHKHAFKEID